MDAGSNPAASSNLWFSMEIHAPIDSLAHYTDYERAAAWLDRAIAARTLFRRRRGR
jgi:hypothetical protein